MGRLARTLYELVQQLPPVEREEFLRLVAAGQPGPAATEESAADAIPPDLPSYSAGRWLGGGLGRDEIYADEADHALSD